MRIESWALVAVLVLIWSLVAAVFLAVLGGNRQRNRRRPLAPRLMERGSLRRVA
jgi:hypothetical protein